jgi:hypothetical protein
VTSGLIAVLEQHKFIVLLKGMRDILSKLNLLNVSMQTQSLPFSTLKVLVNATREGLKREWIDLSAPSHPMLVSGACVTGGDSFKKLVEQMKSGGLDQDDSDDKTFKRHSMGDSLLACLMMIHSNGPSLHEKEEVEKFLLAVVARFKAFKRRVQSRGCGAHPQRASASKAKSSVLSQLSGLENVVFNDFIDDELDSEDVSEQRASASLPDSVPIESEEERAAREADEMAALDAVGDYEADPNVMLEDVPQDIVIKTLKVSCACVPVLVFACVCVYVRARDVDMCS